LDIKVSVANPLLIEQIKTYPNKDLPKRRFILFSWISVTFY
jgi:hypothetical protein